MFVDSLFRGKLKRKYCSENFFIVTGTGVPKTQVLWRKVRTTFLSYIASFYSLSKKGKRGDKT